MNAALSDRMPDPCENQRFIVLVPDSKIDEIALGRCIWDLALTYRSDVLFLSAVQNPDQELAAVHRMTVLSAVTNDPRFHIETALKFDKSWRKAIQEVWKPGDVIVCCAEHTTRSSLLSRVYLSSLVKDRMQLPIYVLPNLNHAPSGVIAGVA